VLVAGAPVSGGRTHRNTVDVDAALGRRGIEDSGDVMPAFGRQRHRARDPVLGCVGIAPAQSQMAAGIDLETIIDRAVGALGEHAAGTAHGVRGDPGLQREAGSELQVERVGDRGAIVLTVEAQAAAEDAGGPGRIEIEMRRRAADAGMAVAECIRERRTGTRVEVVSGDSGNAAPGDSTSWAVNPWGGSGMGGRTRLHSVLEAAPSRPWTLSAVTR
jgi:hypothetical protein